MGQGFRYTCQRCRHEYCVQLGSGMLISETTRTVITDLHAGKYGLGMQKAVKAYKHITVHPDLCLYVCPDCGNRCCLPFNHPG